MTGFVIFLSIVLAVLVGSIVVLIVLIINISHKISHSQENVRTIQERATKASDTFALTSSVIAVLSGLTAPMKRPKRKQ